MTAQQFLCKGDISTEVFFTKLRGSLSPKCQCESIIFLPEGYVCLLNNVFICTHFIFLHEGGVEILQSYDINQRSQAYDFFCVVLEFVMLDQQAGYVGNS